MTLPHEMLPSLLSALASQGDDSEIQGVTLLTGGCINHTVRLETSRGAYLLKWNHTPLPGMFRQEAAGLRLLAETKTVLTPEIIAVLDENQEGLPAFIILEYIDPPKIKPNHWEAEEFGAQLAEMHYKTASVKGQRFGLDHDNYLGASLQPNRWSDDWVTFFREYRLDYQIRLAQNNGHLPPARQKMITRLLDRLPQFLGSQPHQPALLHGDLWSGNVIPDTNNRATLIDPAVYYGDREAEIAYTELFGGFSRRFYQAYDDTWPLEKNYSERRDLYNIYHLLNHLNLFGEAYGSQIDAILKYYVG